MILAIRFLVMVMDTWERQGNVAVKQVTEVRLFTKTELLPAVRNALLDSGQLKDWELVADLCDALLQLTPGLLGTVTVTKITTVPHKSFKASYLGA